MAFLKVGKEVKPERLYIMVVNIPNDPTTYIKIGKSSGTSSKARLLQICGSIYDKYRTTPVMSIKRDRKTEDVFKKETILHRFFASYALMTETPFDGSSEIFNIPIEDAVQAYEAVLDGAIPQTVYLKEEDVIPWL